MKSLAMFDCETFTACIEKSRNCLRINIDDDSRMFF